jgi:hypothetical protein
MVSLHARRRRADGEQAIGAARTLSRIVKRGYLPDKPRQYSSKAKNAQEAMRQSGRPISPGTMPDRAIMRGSTS